VSTIVAENARYRRENAELKKQLREFQNPIVVVDNTISARAEQSLENALKATADAAITLADIDDRLKRLEAQEGSAPDAA
jgi:hypothetical protein